MADHIDPLDTRAVLLAAALDYAAAGLPVFLLGRAKRPVANCPACPKVEHDPGHDPQTCGHLTCHGFYAATCDPDRIRAMLAAVPGGLLAMRTGTVAGRVVVDIDPRNGGRIDTAVMMPTATVATGGGGWHLHYRHPGVPLAAKLAERPGVDIKTDGGYTVLPPSVHPGTGRPYQWIGGRPVVEMPPPLVTAYQRVTAPPPAAIRPAGAAATRPGRIPAAGASHPRQRCWKPTSPR